MNRELFELNAAVEQEHWWFVGRRHIVRALLADILPPDRTRRVVDVGCGTGTNVAELARDYQVLGVDGSSEAIRLSRERYNEVEFICGRAPQDIVDEKNTVDAYLLMDVLEHVPDPQNVLAALTNSLKPGGFLIITVPADMRLWSRHDASHGHYRRYDPQMLRDTWKGLPVQEHVVSHFNARLFPIVFAIRKLTGWLDSSWGETDSDISLPPSPVNALLTKALAGETSRLLDALHGQRRGYRHGVSLVAILERTSDRTI